MSGQPGIAPGVSACLHATARQTDPLSWGQATGCHPSPAHGQSGSRTGQGRRCPGPPSRGPPAPGVGGGRQGPARSCPAGLGLKTALSPFSALKSHRFLLENVLIRVTRPNRLQGRRQNHEPAGQRAHGYLRHRSLEGCTFP